MTETEERDTTNAQAREAIKAKLSDRWWRLNNLYKIQPKFGPAVTFTMNDAQQLLYWELHYRNVDLKARQLGGTTFFCLLALDACLFNDNFAAGFIAHNREDAEDIFTKKIIFAYENLPDWLQEAVPALQKSSKTLRLNNGSSIRVGTSLRSGTYHFLHVSEMGKIAHKYPEKAVEVVAGAFPTVPADGIIVVESTFEGGKGGEFYKLLKLAMEKVGQPLGRLDFKFHFQPWTIDPRYRIDGPEPDDPEMVRYFADLAKQGITLDRQQRAWYAGMWRTLKSKMQQEYPTTPEEAMNVEVEGAYYGKEMTKARTQGRICGVPHEGGSPVFTFWDLGIDDSMTVWFMQFIGREIRVIDYYEASGEGFPHYKRVLDRRAEQYDYTYGQHFAPHDIKQRELTTGLSRMAGAKAIGLEFERVPVVPSLDIAHDAVRDILPRCYFDATKCERGIACMEAYRQKVDETTGVGSGVPIHDWASHGASGFQTMAVAMKRGQIHVGAGATVRRIVRDTAPRDPHGNPIDDGISPRVRRTGTAISGGLSL